MPFHQLGLREVLPVYPFLILIAASAGEWLWKTKIPRQPCLAKIALIGLLSFHVLTTTAHYPAHISYFNELVSPERRLYWLGDSNLDMGQDVKRLADTAKTHGWKNIKLAFFGPTDPALYGMTWDYWRESDLAGPQPGWIYVVNDAFFQLGPAFLWKADLISKGWISEKTPTGRIGDTWTYFEIPGTPNLKDSSQVLASAPFFKALNRY